jgi:hypothetical protein
MKISIHFLLLLLSATTHARIGETLEESVARYGPVIKEGTRGTIFQKGDFDLQVHFFEGKADYLCIIKDPSAASPDFTMDEIESLVASNLEGMKYSRQNEGKKFVYLTPFAKIGAVYDPSDKSLTIMSDEYVLRNKEAAQSRGEPHTAPAASTSGF